MSHGRVSSVQVGDFVYAKLRGFPWWPAVVTGTQSSENDPPQLKRVKSRDPPSSPPMVEVCWINANLSSAVQRSHVEDDETMLRILDTYSPPDADKKFSGKEAARAKGRSLAIEAARKIKEQEEEMPDMIQQFMGPAAARRRHNPPPATKNTAAAKNTPAMDAKSAIGDKDCAVVGAAAKTTTTGDKDLEEVQTPAAEIATVEPYERVFQVENNVLFKNGQRCFLLDEGKGESVDTPNHDPLESIFFTPKCLRAPFVMDIERRGDSRQFPNCSVGVILEEFLQQQRVKFQCREDRLIRVRRKKIEDQIAFDGNRIEDDFTLEKHMTKVHAFDGLLRTLFDDMVESILFPNEVHMWNELFESKRSPSEVFGAAHLLRFLIVLPRFLAENLNLKEDIAAIMEWESNITNLEEGWKELIKFLADLWLRDPWMS